MSQSKTRLFEKLDNGEIHITDDMIIPPTFMYLPSEDMLTFMINRACKAEKDENGEYGYIF